MSTEPQNATIISGFPGILQSHLLSTPLQPSLSAYTLIDLDTTPYSHTNSARNPLFPTNYITTIKSYLSTPNLILLIGAHDTVRNALVENGIRFTLVYPERGLGDEYVGRWRAKESPEALVELLGKNWEGFLGSCESQRGCERVVLGKGVFLEGVLEDVVLKG